MKFHRPNEETDNTAPATVHWLFRISLPDGSVYAADFTCAQFVAWPKPMMLHGIMPWNDYLCVLRLNPGEIIESHDALEPAQPPYSEDEIHQLVSQTELTTPEQRDRLNEVVISICTTLTLQDLLIQHFFAKLRMPTKYLLEILNCPERLFKQFFGVVRDRLRYFLFAWRFVLCSGKNEHAAYLLTMWNLLKTALRVTGMTAQDFGWGEFAAKPLGHDTPLQI